MCWSYESKHGFLKAGSLTYYCCCCCSPNFLVRIIKNQCDEQSKFKVIFEKCFENLLTPTPEELILVDIAVGDGSADAYLHLLEETKKILD